MALDEAILESTSRGICLPTVRLYSWEPACLSLGYAQPVSDVDMTALSTRGWDLVRRPTGGRAILHTDELTYSVCGPQDNPHLTGGVLESYRRLAQGLLLALHQLRIPAEALEKYAPAPTGNQVLPVCFEVPSNYEITVHGKKLVGSAQARRGQGVLQHGSLPLKGDLTRITQVLSFPDEATRQAAAQRLLERAVTVEEILGAPLPWESAAAAFLQGFEQSLGIQFLVSEPTPEENQRARELVVQKYGTREWNQRL